MPSETSLGLLSIAYEVSFVSSNLSPITVTVHDVDFSPGWKVMIAAFATYSVPSLRRAVHCRRYPVTVVPDAADRDTVNFSWHERATCSAAR